MATILVVDDDEQVCLFIQRLLTRIGHQVMTVQDGRKALESTGSKQVDLAIIDLFMPNKDGIEMLMELRSRNQALKCIAMTGHTTPLANVGLLTMLNLGAQRTISKPCSTMELISAVDDVLSSSAKV